MLTPDAYNDAQELEKYLIRNRHRLRTEFERRAEDLGTKREKPKFAIADGRAAEWTTRVLAEYESDVTPDIRAAIGETLETFVAFQNRITERIRTDFANGVAHPNRCPRCDRIVKTPSAAQCLWCNHDWH